VQSCLKLMEPSVTVHARPQDAAVVTQATSAAARTYKDISGRDIKFEVEGTLNKDRCVLVLCVFVQDCEQTFCSAGGVKVINGTRRITVDNTLDERLRLLEDKVCGSYNLIYCCDI
jgi:V-type H+-transporting ATPase subunit E